jgi:hypothetical protein
MWMLHFAFYNQQGGGWTAISVELIKKWSSPYGHGEGINRGHQGAQAER